MIYYITSKMGKKTSKSIHVHVSDKEKKAFWFKKNSRYNVYSTQQSCRSLKKSKQHQILVQILTRRFCDEEYTSLFFTLEGVSSGTSWRGPVTVALRTVWTSSEPRPPAPTVWILKPWYCRVSTFFTMALAMWGLLACWCRCPFK